MKPITRKEHEVLETKGEEAKEMKTGKEAFPGKKGERKLAKRAMSKRACSRK